MPTVQVIINEERSASNYFRLRTASTTDEYDVSGKEEYDPRAIRLPGAADDRRGDRGAGATRRRRQNPGRWAKPDSGHALSTRIANHADRHQSPEYARVCAPGERPPGDRRADPRARARNLGRPGAQLPALVRRRARDRRPAGAQPRYRG